MCIMSGNFPGEGRKPLTRGEKEILYQERAENPFLSGEQETLYQERAEKPLPGVSRKPLNSVCVISTCLDKMDMLGESRNAEHSSGALCRNLDVRVAVIIKNLSTHWERSVTGSLPWSGGRPGTCRGSGFTVTSDISMYSRSRIFFTTFDGEDTRGLKAPVPAGWPWWLALVVGSCARPRQQLPKCLDCWPLRGQGRRVAGREETPLGAWFPVVLYL